jgi:hypothetical protein
MDSNFTNNINEILFKYSEGELSPEQLDILLAETENDINLEDELEKWEQTKISEDLPITTDLEEKILAKTINKGTFPKTQIYTAIALITGITLFLFWPNNNEPVINKIPKQNTSNKSTIISSEANPTIKEKNIVNKQLIKSKNITQIDTISITEVENNIAAPSPTHIEQINLKEEFKGETVKSNSDSIVNEIQITQPESQVQEPTQTKKRKKKKWLMPSNSVLPINRDF